MGSIQSSSKPNKIIGLNLPLSHIPKNAYPSLIFPYSPSGHHYPWTATTLTIREVCMLHLIEDLTNKPHWWLDVYNQDIVSKWKAEALERDWTEYRDFGDFTPAMADACIHELRVKADLYFKTGLIPIMDYSSTVLKSDILIPSHLNHALSTHVKPLENIPDHFKVWHGKVLNLVHPSLYPLIYGRSKVSLDEPINLSNALHHIHTRVDTLPTPSYQPQEGDFISTRFQWLPCDVSLNSSNGKPTIESYINNLHPIQHAPLYPIIQQFIQNSLPAWDIIYRWQRDFEKLRLKAEHAFISDCLTPEICAQHREAPEPFNRNCEPCNRPIGENEPERGDFEEDETGYEQSERGRLDIKWFTETHKMDLDHLTPSLNLREVTPSQVKTSNFFDGASRIQVIVKLTNIHLTPEKPSYDGESWHIEGLLNERICSTALFYYDCENITEGHVDFRTLTSFPNLRYDLRYEQGDLLSIKRVMAIDPKGDVTQDIGSVLTKPGRALFFPNIYQNRVSPLKLKDASRPGHCKILTLFLVDPAVSILSTAQVPPQQKDWSVNGDIGIDIQEAKEIRQELMAERAMKTEGETGLPFNPEVWWF